MWLLPAFGAVASAALRVFYRFRVAGGTVPPTGPALLVANHPNSLLDPAAVVAAAGRPVRFLAKAPLFTDPQVGWLVRGAGAIPVYRRMDGDAPEGGNDDAFRAAHEALAAGAAIGIFPEGISHSEPAMAPLKTGAARIALGATGLTGHPLTIVPVGLRFRDKARFRSEALVVIGEPIAWDDLRARGETAEGVRALTARIEAALQGVTLNLERWEDEPLVELAEEIHAAHFAAVDAPAERVRRQAAVAAMLGQLRRGTDPVLPPLVRELERHRRLLRAAGLRPAQLAQPRAPEVARWTVRNAALLPAALFAGVGWAVFWAPYRLTGWLEARANKPTDVRATFKVLVGAVLHLGWIAAATLAAGMVAGTGAAIATAALLPPLGLLTIWFEQRRRAAGEEAGRFVTRARRADAIARMRASQEALATRLEQLRQRHAPTRESVG